MAGPTPWVIDPDNMLPNCYAYKNWFAVVVDRLVDALIYVDSSEVREMAIDGSWEAWTEGCTVVEWCAEVLEDYGLMDDSMMIFLLRYVRQ